MIGGSAIGRRPVGAFRLILSGAITGAASVAFTLATLASGTVSTAGAASTGFVVSTLASGTVTPLTVDYTPSASRTRNAAGDGDRVLSAAGDRLRFAAGDVLADRTRGGG